MKTSKAGWKMLVAGMAMVIVGPQFAEAKDRVGPVPADAGPIETGMTLAQAQTAAGAQKFTMEGNLAVAAAMAFVTPPPSGGPPPKPVTQSMSIAPVGPKHPFPPRVPR